MQNTLITLSDNKIGTDTNADNKADFYTASVLSATDYYAFGMSMKERSWQSEKYRYGFNGKEKDTDWDVQDYGFRIYKEELCKFLSVDPLAKDFPWNSAYAFAENDVIRSIDLEGLEKLITIISRTEGRVFLHLVKGEEIPKELVRDRNLPSTVGLSQSERLNIAVSFAESLRFETWENVADYEWYINERGTFLINYPHAEGLKFTSHTAVPTLAIVENIDEEEEYGTVINYAVDAEYNDYTVEFHTMSLINKTKVIKSKDNKTLNERFLDFVKERVIKEDDKNPFSKKKKEKKEIKNSGGKHEENYQPDSTYHYDYIKRKINKIKSPEGIDKRNTTPKRYQPAPKKGG